MIYVTGVLYFRVHFCAGVEEYIVYPANSRGSCMIKMSYRRSRLGSTTRGEAYDLKGLLDPLGLGLTPSRKKCPLRRKLERWVRGAERQGRYLVYRQLLYSCGAAGWFPRTPRWVATDDVVKIRWL
jgi:hypothetical protein